MLTGGMDVEHAHQAMGEVATVSRERLIATVLNVADGREDPGGRLATRMIARMLGTRARPLLGVLHTEQGLAVSLAIHDEFWTDAW
jgi:hypothetical protein